MNLDLEQLGKRLSSVEAGLAEVQQRLGLRQAGVNWVEQLAGSLVDIPDEDYQKFLEACRVARKGCSSDAENSAP